LNYPLENPSVDSCAPVCRQIEQIEQKAKSFIYNYLKRHCKEKLLRLPDEETCFQEGNLLFALSYEPEAFPDRILVDLYGALIKEENLEIYFLPDELGLSEKDFHLLKMEHYQSEISFCDLEIKQLSPKGDSISEISELKNQIEERRNHLSSLLLKIQI